MDPSRPATHALSIAMAALISLLPNTVAAASLPTRAVDEGQSVKFELKLADVQRLARDGRLLVSLPDGTLSQQRLIAHVRRDRTLHLSTTDQSGVSGTFTLGTHHFFATVVGTGDSYAVSGDARGSDWMSHRAQVNRNVRNDQREHPH
ncbi:MAG: hypothetical protein AAF513_18310 [Pseudomonadota bacterium]